MIFGKIKKFKIPFDNRIETFLEEGNFQKHEYLFGMQIEDIDQMTIDVNTLLEYFNFVNDSYSNILLILSQEGFDLFFNYVRVFNGVEGKDQEKIFRCISVLTEKSADIFKNYSKCVREDFTKHKENLEKETSDANIVKKNGKHDENVRYTSSEIEINEETNTIPKIETSQMKNVLLKNSIMKLIVTCLDNNMMEHSSSEKNRGYNILEIKQYLVSYFHVLTFFFINMFNKYYNKYFGNKTKLDFVSTGQRGRKKQKKTLDEETYLNLKNMNTLLNNIIILICSVDFYVIYDSINIIVLDLYLEFFLNVYFLNQECNNTFDMNIYYDQLAEVILNLLQLYIKKDREEILLECSDKNGVIKANAKNKKGRKNQTNNEDDKHETLDVTNLKPVTMQCISYSFADVYLEACKKCSNLRLVDAILMLRHTNIPSEIMKEFYLYIKKNASACAHASTQSVVHSEMNNVLIFVEYFSKNLSYQFLCYIRDIVNLLGTDVPNVRKTILDCFKNIITLAKAAEYWREQMIRKMRRAEKRNKSKGELKEDTGGDDDYSDDEDIDADDNISDMEEEEEEEEEEEIEEEDEIEKIQDDKECGDDDKKKKGKGQHQLSIPKTAKGRKNMKAFLHSSSSGKFKMSRKNAHVNLMNKMLLHDEKFLALCFDKCVRAREYITYLLLTRQHDCKLHVRCHLLKIFSELVENNLIPVIYYNDLCGVCRERINDKSPLVRQRAFALLSVIATDVVKQKYMLPLDTERIQKDLDLLNRRKLLLQKKSQKEESKKKKNTIELTDNNKSEKMENEKNVKGNGHGTGEQKQKEMEKKNECNKRGNPVEQYANANAKAKKKKMNLSGSDTDSDDEKSITEKRTDKPQDITTDKKQKESKEMTEEEKNICKYDLVIQMYKDVLFIATLVDECVRLCFQLLYSTVETDQKSSIKFIILAHLCGNRLAGKQMNQVWSLIYSTNSVIVDMIIHEFLTVNINPSDYRISAFRLINIVLHSKLKELSCIEKIIQSLLMQQKITINIGNLLEELFKIIFIDTFSENKNEVIKEGGLILMKIIFFCIHTVHKRRGEEVPYYILFKNSNVKDVMLFIKTFRNNFHFLNLLALILKYNETTRAVQYCMLALFNWIFFNLQMDNKNKWQPIQRNAKNGTSHKKENRSNGIKDDMNETKKTKEVFMIADKSHKGETKMENEKMMNDKKKLNYKKIKMKYYNYLSDLRSEWFKCAQSLVEGMCEHFRTFLTLMARKMRLSIKKFFRVRRFVVTTSTSIYELSSIKKHKKYKLERKYRNNFTFFTLVKIIFLYGHIGIYSLIHSEKILNQLKDYPCEVDNFGMYTKDEQDREYFDFIVEEKLVCQNLLGKKIVPLLFSIVRGPNRFYRKYALRKKHTGRWKLKKILRIQQIQQTVDKQNLTKAEKSSINGTHVTREQIQQILRKYIKEAHLKKKIRKEIKEIKKKIARRNRRKMLEKMEHILNKNIDKMPPIEIKKFLIKMRKIKSWGKHKKERVIYRRYEMYLLFLVSLLSLCKYAIISQSFCKKKISKKMTLIQLIVAVIVKEYRPIYSRVQRRNNVFNQRKVKVDVYGRIMNLSINSETAHNDEFSKAKLLLFGKKTHTKKKMERYRQTQNKFVKEKTMKINSREQHQHPYKKEALALTQGEKTEENIWEKYNSHIMLKKKKESHNSYESKEGKVTKNVKQLKKKNSQIMLKKVTNKWKNKIGKDQKKNEGNTVRKTLNKKLQKKNKKKLSKKIDNFLEKRTHAKLDTRGKKKLVLEKGIKKRGPPKKKDIMTVRMKINMNNDTTAGIKVGTKSSRRLARSFLKKDKRKKEMKYQNVETKKKLQKKSCYQFLKDAQTYVMHKSVVNLRRMLLISYADLLYRHPNLLEPHNLKIFNVLCDEDVSIRKTAVAVFTHLYMTDTVKAKTVLLVHMMFLTVDNDEKISSGAKSFFYELDRKAHNTLANNIADMITLVIRNDRSWSFEKNKGIIEFLLYFMKKSKYSESLSEKIIRKMAEVDLKNANALNLYVQVFLHIHLDEKVLQRILNCICLIKHVIRENEYVYEKFLQLCKRAGEKRRGRPTEESQQQAHNVAASNQYAEQGGKDTAERNEGKMKELSDSLFYEVEAAKQNSSVWSVSILSNSVKKRYSKGKGGLDPTPSKKDATPKRRESTPQKIDNSPPKRDSTPQKRNSTPQKRNSTPQKRNSTPLDANNAFKQRNSVLKKRNSTPKKSNILFNWLDSTPSRSEDTPNKLD